MQICYNGVNFKSVTHFINQTEFIFKFQNFVDYVHVEFKRQAFKINT